MPSSFFKVQCLLWRLINVEVDTNGVLNTIACRSDGDRIVVVKVPAAATSHGANRSQREQKQGGVRDEAAQLAGRTTGVAKAKQRQQEESECNGGHSARPAFWRLRGSQFASRNR